MNTFLNNIHPSLLLNVLSFNYMLYRIKVHFFKNNFPPVSNTTLVAMWAIVVRGRVAGCPHCRKVPGVFANTWNSFQLPFASCGSLPVNHQVPCSGWILGSHVSRDLILRWQSHARHLERTQGLRAGGAAHGTRRLRGVCFHHAAYGTRWQLQLKNSSFRGKG